MKHHSKARVATRSQRTQCSDGDQAHQEDLDQDGGLHLFTDTDPDEVTDDRDASGLSAVSDIERRPLVRDKKLGKYKYDTKGSSSRGQNRKRYRSPTPIGSSGASESGSQASENTDLEPRTRGKPQRQEQQPKKRDRRSASFPEHSRRLTISTPIASKSNMTQQNQQSFNLDDYNEQATTATASGTVDNTLGSEVGFQSLQLGVSNTSSRSIKGTLSERMGTQGNRALSRSIREFL